MTAAVAYLDSLRAAAPHRRSAAQPEKRAFFGLLPQSISHEGYSAKPMHSYWDDFFALRGSRTRRTWRGRLGHDDEARALAAIRDEFAARPRASIARRWRGTGIDYIPGCADLGDFDATSTTIALCAGRRRC